jgi:uncharacterized protein YpmB
MMRREPICVSLVSSMSRNWKWVSIGLGNVILVVIISFQINNWIHKSEWKAQDNAIQLAKQNSTIQTVTKVDRFVGDKTSYIVFGKDPQLQDIIVWVTEFETHSEWAEDGITDQDASNKVKARDPANQVIRTTSAIWFDQYAWEVYYKKKEEQETRYFYDYYRFHDGQYLDTYSLSTR